MKQLVALVIFALLAASILACSAVTPTPKPTPALPAVKASSRIVAEGRVVPARGATLSFQIAGKVAEVFVALGDRVETGKVLAQLDARQLELQLAQAEANLAAAQAKLNQLKRGPTTEDVTAAQQNLKSAQAAYDNLLRPPADELATLKTEMEKAKALVDRAQAAYDRIGGDAHPFATMTQERAELQMAWLTYEKALALYNLKVKPTQAQIEQAQSAVQNAKMQLAKLQPAAEDVAAAQANVNAALAARDLAAEQLKNTKLTAPFAGVVTVLDLKAGETVAPGTPVLRLADNTTWQVETTDLTDINIVNVHVGDAATVTLDAIPGLELAGTVERIKGYGENRQGDIVYTVVVKLAKPDERLRWNMTAKVSVVK